MVPMSASTGITVPQDSSATELIALFTGPLSDPRPLAYDLAARQLAELPAAHCSPPSWAICAPGSCGGCKPFKFWDPVAGSEGLECRCPDDRE
jgi:hypothetical protein